MTRALLPITVVLASLLLSVSGNSLLGTLLSVRMAIEGFDRELIGPVLAFHSIGFVLGTMFCPPIVRRVGHIRSFAAFAAIACIAALMHPLIVTTISWALLRGVTGFCVAGLMMVMESWINDRTSNDLRGSIMAFYMGTQYLGQGGGQFLLGFGDPDTTILFIISAALVAASLVPLALTRSRAPELEYHEPMGLRRLLRISPVGIVGALVAGTVMSAFMAVGPVFAHEAGYGVRDISVFMGVTVLMGMAMQAPVGFLAARLNRRTLVLMISTIALALVAPLLMFAADSFSALLISSSLFIGFVGSIYPLSVALTNDQLDPHHVVNASATLLLALGAGTIIGPIGASIAMAAFPEEGLFLFLGAALSVMVIFALVRAVSVGAGKVRRRSRYMPGAPAPTTQVILEMDPSNPDFHPHVITPEHERRRGPDRRQGHAPGGRRRTDAWDSNE